MSSPAAPERGLPSDVLLVEDNFIIALDVEDMLHQIGVARVRVAHTVTDALRAIEAQPPEYALLDVDLGHDKCFEVAIRLRELGIPFAFATGYGTFYSFPADFTDVQIVAKPYTLETLHTALSRP